MAIRLIKPTTTAALDIGAWPATVVVPLTRVGFTNYPSEWWHWSFGDRYWAVMQNESHAIYGPVDESMLGEASR
nr:M15 family metallopeptidase [Burkholderia sp. AU32357]